MMNYFGTVPRAEGEQTLVEETASRTGARQAMPVLLEYWLIVRRRRWIILAIVLTCLFAGLLITLLMTPQYTAAARIEISRDRQQVTNVEGIEGSDANRNAEFYETQYALLRARSVAERVARSLKLASNPEFFEAHGVTPAGAEAFADSSQPLTAAELEQREKQAVNLLLEHVEIVPIERSSLVDIRYTSAAPVLSATIPNAWAEEFIADSIDRRFSSTVDARKFLEGRLADLRNRVQRSERDLVNYANQEGIIVFEQTTEDGRTQNTQTMASVNLQAMNEALAEATAARVEAEARARASGRANPAALVNPAITALRQRKAEAQAQYARMMVQFEPEYPGAQALREQIESLDAAIAREEARVLESVDSDYRSALRRERTLQQRVAALTSNLVEQERDKIQYNIYQREVDTNRQLYDGLLQRYKEIGVAGVAANNIALVDEAQVPTRPSSPNLPLNLGIALLVGLGLAGVAIFTLEQFDEGIRHPSDIPRTLGLPLLGSVPAIEDQEVTEVLNDPKSEISEAYLTVRSNLAFSTDHGVPRSLMITSTRPTEGKSTTSFAMALVLARTGKRVLLIDADMRSPSLHQIAGMELGSGLSSYLAGDDDWRKLANDTQWPNVTMITGGTTPPSAGELLSGDRMQRLIELALQEFDHVVVDSPPLLGLADAPLLSRSAEGVIYVVEAAGVPARGINMSLDRLRASHAHILGAILTKLKRRDVQGAGYGYGYGYGYGLSYGKDRVDN